MKPKRSAVDWTLEAVAFGATLAGIVLAVSALMDDFPAPRRYFPYRGIWTVRNGLWVVTLLNAAAYIGLTAATHWEKLIHIPADMDRDYPHVRQLLFSMVIVLKTVLMLFSLCLVWALVNVGQGRGTGLSGKFLTLFVLAVPLPLIFYTVKLRRYRR